MSKLMYFEAGFRSGAPFNKAQQATQNFHKNCNCLSYLKAHLQMSSSTVNLLSPVVNKRQYIDYVILKSCLVLKNLLYHNKPNLKVFSAFQAQCPFDAYICSAAVA